MRELITWKDIEAVEKILTPPPKPWVFFPVSGLPQLTTHLAQSVQLAYQGGRLAVLIGEELLPEEKYVVVRLVDLPHLAVAIYDRLIGQK
jgi:hypothetical protein